MRAAPRAASGEGSGLATIVHRRPAAALGPEAPRGPGGSFDSLTWVGYASLVAAFGFLVFGLRPLTEMGDPRMWNWGEVPYTIMNPVRSAAVLLLPAALEFGVPGARRAVPWLMRGTVLLALEELLRPLIRAAQSALIEGQMFDFGVEMNYADPAWLALTLVSLAVTIIGIAGAWSVSDGLADAGGRPRRAILVLLAAGGTALSLVYVPVLAIDPSEPVDASIVVAVATNLLSFALGLLDNVLWLIIGARLVAGLVPRRLVPRTAWAIGAMAGAALIAVRLTSPLIFVWIQPDRIVGYVFLYSGTLAWVLLAVAFAAGLGRGRVRRRPRPRRLRLFVLNPTR